MFISNSPALMYSGGALCLQPIFLHGLSASSHLVMFLLLSIYWACQRIKINESSHNSSNSKQIRFSYYKSILFSCLGPSLFHLWYSNGWSDEQHVSQLDLVLRTVTWVTLFVYLYTQFSHFAKDLVGFYFLLCSYFLVTEVVLCRNNRVLQTQFWVLDITSVVVGLFTLHAGVVGKKGLTPSSQSRQCHSSGEIINFMTVDADRIDVFGWYLHDLWMAPIQVSLALVMLYKNFGLASIAAFVATVIVMVAKVPFSTWQEKFQDKFMESKDERMKFLSKIINLWKNEAGWLKKYVYTSAMTMAVFWGDPTFISVVAFGAFILMGLPLESAKILSALATFRILQEPIYKLPDTISIIAQAKVSLDRIASFLSLSDMQPDIIEKLPKSTSEVAIEIKNGIFSWDILSPTPTLKDLNIRVNHGMRVAICGTIGSGKSSLLSCILGEIPKVSGIINLCGTKAFVAQSPCIQSGKIVENILFGKDMDRVRYEMVLDACSLKYDLGTLYFGDQTVIGESGINLSGGQKQRIQIARALYQDADIYLFDDPFSVVDDDIYSFDDPFRAVDSPSGTHVFKECLFGILGSKTVIYVTHQVEFLLYADRILVMKDGRITQAGKYVEILGSETDFMEHLEALG